MRIRMRFDPGEDWEPVKDRDREPEEEPDPGGGILPLIDLESFYDLLMEEQEQMYLFSFLSGLFMQHMAHSLCLYYITNRPLFVDFIDFSSFYTTKSEA